MGMTTPFPEPESSSLEQFAIYSRVEVLALLRQLIEHGVLVNVYYDQGPNFFLSVVLAVNPQFEELIFDAAADEAAQARLLASRRIVFVAFIEGVKVQFEAQRAEETSFDGRAAVRVRMPERVLRLQRREFFRVRPLSGRPVTCTIRDALHPQQSASLRVLDISGGGIALAIDPARNQLSVGEELPDCVIEFPGEGSIAASLRIRVIELLPHDGAGQRLGCEYVRMAPQAHMMLQRYVNRVEAEQRKVLAHGA